MKNPIQFLAIALAISVVSVLASDGNRMPPISPEKYDAAQRKVAEEFLQARKVPIFGPYDVLIRSPEFMGVVRQMGDYLRFKPAIGTTLSEFIILMVARQWSQDYEWYVHAPIAAKQGIKQDIINALAEGRRPSGMSDDETILYDFIDELGRNRCVSDGTYDRAVKRFGEQGVVDITGLAGNYTLIAMILNVSRTPIPSDGMKLPRLPD